MSNFVHGTYDFMCDTICQQLHIEALNCLLHTLKRTWQMIMDSLFVYG